MICFKCGRHGHKEDTCGLDKENDSDTTKSTTQGAQGTAIPTAQENQPYGSWMMVRKPSRRTPSRQQAIGARTQGRDQGEAGHHRERLEQTRVDPGTHTMPILEVNCNSPRMEPNQNLGSRFRALTDLDLNMEAEDNGRQQVASKETPSYAGPQANMEDVNQEPSREHGVDRDGPRPQERPRKEVNRPEPGAEQHERALVPLGQRTHRPIHLAARQNVHSRAMVSLDTASSSRGPHFQPPPLGLTLLGPARVQVMNPQQAQLLGDLPDVQAGCRSGTAGEHINRQAHEATGHYVQGSSSEGRMAMDP